MSIAEFYNHEKTFEVLAAKYKYLSDNQNKKQIPKHPTGIFNKIQYSVIKFGLYLFIIPVTAGFIQVVLSSSGNFSKTNSMVMSWVLAFFTDYVAFDHLSKIRNLQSCHQSRINLCVASCIIIANMFGAFIFFEREIQLDQLSVISTQRTSLKKELSEKLLGVTKARTTYLLNKWPKSNVDRESCELSRVPDCGPMFDTKSRAFEASFLNAKQIYDHKKRELESLPKLIPQAQAKTELWWHFGYYIFIWLLLGSVIRMEKLSQA